MVKTSGSGQEPNTPPADDWVSSFEDVELSWSGPEPIGEASRRSNDEVSAEQAGGKPPAEPDRRSADTPPPVTRRMRRARRARRRIIVTAIVVVLMLCGAVAAVALTARDGGGASASRTSTTAGTERAAATTAAVTTTVAPPTTPVSAAPGPGAFTVRSTCGGRDCPVSVHAMPTTAAAKGGSLRTGAVVQVSCSAHGEAVTDRDTGQRSDVWYHLAGGGYVSAMYLDGPTVPDCG